MAKAQLRLLEAGDGDNYRPTLSFDPQIKAGVVVTSVARFVPPNPSAWLDRSNDAKPTDLARRRLHKAGRINGKIVADDLGHT